METIGFIGLGAMGLPMARNIMKKGFPLVAHDIVDSKREAAVAAGAQRAASAKEVAARSDIVITILPAASDVQTAILGPDGVLDGIRAGSTVIEMSTVDAATVEALAKPIASKGAGLLAAPVVRGVAGAVNGTLGIYAGGDPAVFERCKPVLSAVGTDIEYCGALGTGNTVKLVNNMVVGITVCVLAEAMALGVKGGVDPDVLYESLAKGSANSFVLQNHVRKHAMTGDFREGLFSIDYEMKDLDLALACADNLQVPQSFASLAYQTYQQARALGLSKSYYPAVFQVIERLAGVEVRSKAGK